MATVSTEIFRFFKSHDFKRALLMAVTMFLCGLALYAFGYNELIVGICIGILLTSFCDSQGSFRHRTLAMVLSVIMNVIIVIVVNLINHSLPLLLLFFAVVTPLISFLSVYGNRAGFFAFSGLLGIVLSLVKDFTGPELIRHTTVLALGGIIYIGVSSLYHWLSRRSQINQQLGELTALTGEFLQLRINISKGTILEEDAQQQLLEQQVEIAEKQDSLRELILSDRFEGGKSNTRNRQMLILVELIDIMELAIANRSSFAGVQNNVKNQKEYLTSFLQMSDYIVSHICLLSKVLLDNKPLSEFSEIEAYLQNADAAIDKYVKEIGLPEARRGAIALRNYHDYLEKQAKKVQALYRLLSDVARQRSLSINKKKFSKFLPREDYSPQVFKENLSFQSPFFRHSLKLTIAMVIGYSIGVWLNVSNAYWILLTIVVILRPSFGLTKERSQKRVLGTVIGVIIASAIVLLTDNIVVYVVLALVSMIFAFSLLNRNYTAAATAITLNVVFVFSLINPDQWEIIQFRLIDTLIGAVVSMFVSYLIFPVWEFESIETALKNVIKSNKNYLKEITSFYLQPEQDDTEYRLKRKQAFLDTTDLNASFQRFMHDPKSKQIHFSNYYELVLLNQALLSSMTSLGNYIQNHHKASLNEEFQVISDSIQQELMNIYHALAMDNDLSDSEQHHQQFIQAQENIDKHWNKLESARDTELSEGKVKIDKDFRLQLQEVRFLQQELDWMKELTKNMKDVIANIHPSVAV